MKRTRVHYWSCSSFADWVRGTIKSGAKTAEDWDAWHKTSKRASPWRYWIAEEGLDALQDIVYWPNDVYHTIRYYIANRYIDRTHALTAHPRNISRGDWCDLGNRFLPCMFNELVDFIEVELALHHVAWDKEARARYNAPRKFLRSWRTWRSPEAGLDYLRWATELTNEEWLSDESKHLAEPTGQALAAREMLELYNWWKNIYPNRPDPHDASGWSAWCNRRRSKLKEEDGEDYRWSSLFSQENETEEQRKEARAILDRCSEIETQYEGEDLQMMIRLLKIRKHLWT